MFCKLSTKKKLGVIFSMIITLNHDQESKATRKSNPRLFTRTKITWDPTGVRLFNGHLVRIPRDPRMRQYKDGDYREEAPHFTTNSSVILT